MYQQLDQFVNYIREVGKKSVNTQLSYQRDLRQLFDWLKERHITELSGISPAELKAYTEALKAEGKSAATISRSIASIKAFFQYALEQEWLKTNPGSELKPPKVLKKAPVVIGEQDVERLLMQPSEETPKGIRDRAMLQLLHDTGLRVSELIGLRLYDVDLKRREVTVEAAKKRVVTYGKQTAKYMNQYAKTVRAGLLGESRADTFFVNCSGEGMTRQGFWKLIKKYGREAGIETEMTPHVMRHSFAAQALKEGRDLKTVQSIMGHSDAATTNGYTNLSSY